LLARVFLESEKICFTFLKSIFTPPQILAAHFSLFFTIVHYTVYHWLMQEGIEPLLFNHNKMTVKKPREVKVCP